jgi:class 3 adenylate cyclase
VLDQRGQLLRAALGFAGLPRPPYDRSLWALRSWLDSCAGSGWIAVAMRTRATISNSRGTTSKAVVRLYPRPEWSTRRRARRAPRGSARRGTRRSHAAVVKIRVGLNSGEVVGRAIGSDLHMDYRAVGQTTHLAARMEQLADPGAIVITPDVASNAPAQS